MKKQRLDDRIMEAGFAADRDQARRLAMSGRVLVNGHPLTHAGETIAADAVLSLKDAPRYASRGGEKLEVAFTRFDLDVRDALCLDVGASTGGFTDCLLQHGARHVIALDVGKGLLDWRLRQDSRVTVMEGVNARFLTPDQVSGRPSVAVFDVSFISLKLVLPPVVQVMDRPARLVTLIKPQFEADRHEVGRGGVVRDGAVRDAVVQRIRSFGEQLPGRPLTWIGCCESPVRGPAGNIEYVACWESDAHGYDLG